MLLEPHPGTSLVGATASFFLAKQFEHLRTADRFWYENEPKDGHTFTPGTRNSLSTFYLNDKNITLPESRSYSNSKSKLGRPLWDNDKGIRHS